MKTFLIADTHFGEENMIRYENRPFQSSEEMNESMIKLWNEIVSEEDEVYHLGDVGDVSVISQLHGKKYLIKGNHDIESDDYYRAIGFEKVYDLPVIYENFWILSHEPMYVNRNMPYANIFGHVHANPIYKTCSEQSYCVSVERIQYAPIALDEVKKAIVDQK